MLRLFEDVVVPGALVADLGGHAVEALRAAFGSGKGHVGDGAGDAAVAVVEGVDGDEPEVGLRGFEDGVDGGGRVEPFQEGAHFRG